MRVCRISTILIQQYRAPGGRCRLPVEGGICALRSRVWNSSKVSQRYLCANKSGEDSLEGKGATGNDSDSKAKSRGDPKSAEAKAKLQSLLRSIVQDSKEAASRAAEKGVIDLKLAAPIKEKKEPTPVEIKTQEEKEAEKDLGKEMIEAVKIVAKTVSVSGETQAVESELVQKLKTQVGKKINLSDVFVGMKIDKTPRQAKMASAVDTDLSRAHRVRKIMSEKGRPSHIQDSSQQTDQPPRQRRSPPPSQKMYVPIDLFGATPLGIFTSSGEGDSAPKKETPLLETWDALYQRDLKLAVTHPPANGFEEMILWTEQGKLWKFPIDNEQGFDEEAKVPFHEHVFLEPQLESWCPTKGPIRQFMELVCVGLSKNPFLTVKEKHDQIEWYHTYFKERADIIKEVGAGEIK